MRLEGVHLWRRKGKRMALVLAGMNMPSTSRSSPRIRDMMGTLWYSLAEARVEVEVAT